MGHDPFWPFAENGMGRNCAGPPRQTRGGQTQLDKGQQGKLQARVEMNTFLKDSTNWFTCKSGLEFRASEQTTNFPADLDKKPPELRLCLHSVITDFTVTRDKDGRIA